KWSTLAARAGPWERVAVWTFPQRRLFALRCTASPLVAPGQLCCPLATRSKVGLLVRSGCGVGVASYELRLIPILAPFPLSCDLFSERPAAVKGAPACRRGVANPLTARTVLKDSEANKGMAQPSTASL